MEPIELSPVFKGFLSWVEDLQQCFSCGFKPRFSYDKRAQKGWRPADHDHDQAAKFDDETLEGRTIYATVLTAVSHLSRKLKGFAIRDPKYSPVFAG